MRYPFPAFTLAPVLLVALLAGCSSKNEGEADNEANLSSPIVNVTTLPPNDSTDEGMENATSPAMTDGTSEAQSRDQVPLAIRGRWGLVAADCTSRDGDAKGLLEISAKVLGFYESRGVLQSIRQWAPNRLHADFDFSGEGMSWSREMELDLQADGRTLIRRDHGKDAQPGPLRYRRCTA